MKPTIELAVIKMSGEKVGLVHTLCKLKIVQLTVFGKPLYGMYSKTYTTNLEDIP